MTTGTFILPDGRGDKTKILLTPLGAGMIIGKGGATIKQIKVLWNLLLNPGLDIEIFFSTLFVFIHLKQKI